MITLENALTDFFIVKHTLCNHTIPLLGYLLYRGTKWLKKKQTPLRLKCQEYVRISEKIQPWS